MIVEELIKVLQECDPKMIVVLSSDCEGNRFHKLAGVEGDNQVFDERERSVGFEKMTPTLRKQGYSNEDLLASGVPCVVLWPA